MPLILIWYSYSVCTYLTLFVPLFVFNNLLLLFIVQLQSRNLFVYDQLMNYTCCLKAIPSARYYKINQKIVTMELSIYPALYRHLHEEL